MNNYLLQLLKEVKTLIIPGLGALTVTNESTGEILFMPYLKFDDGTLAKHIASKENIDQQDASNMISKFVREVTAELDKGNTYDMYQFGRFVKVDGEIAFESWNDKPAASKTDSTSPENSAAAQTPAEKPAPVKEEQKPVQEEGPPVIVPPVRVEVKPIVEQPKKEEPAPVVKEEKIVPPAAEEPKKAVETPKKEDTPIVVENLKVEEAKIVPPQAEKPVQKAPEKPVQPKKTPVPPVKDPKAPKEKKKTSVFAYILWGFLVLILGAGTFVAIRFDELKKDFPILADLAGDNDNVAKGSKEVKELEEDPDTITDSETEAEPIPEDEVQVVEDQLPEPQPEPVKEQPKKTPSPAPKKTPAPAATKPKTVVTVNKKPVTKTQTTGSAANFDGSKHFHIIAGSFGSEANANKLAGKLRNQGFSESSVTMNNGMYRVSVKGFNTLNEATAEAASIQSSVPGAWVLKM